MMGAQSSLVAYYRRPEMTTQKAQAEARESLLRLVSQPSVCMLVAFFLSRQTLLNCGCGLVLENGNVTCQRVDQSR